MTSNDIAESPRIGVALSNAFQNKHNINGMKSNYQISFISSEITPQQLSEHICSGQAWAMGNYRGRNRSKETFLSSQFLALDFDHGVSVAVALEQPLIKEYAFLVHPTASSTPEKPKTRVIFILDEPVTQPSVWETMQRGLIAHFAHLNPDKACKDAARMFFGSDVPGAIFNYDARLLITVAGALTRPEAMDEWERILAASRAKTIKYKARVGKHGGLSRELVEDVERGLGVWGAEIGSSGFVREPIQCPVKDHEHDDENPATYWHPEKKIAYCHKCHCAYLTRDIASALGIEIRKTVKEENDGIKECCIRYISEYPLGKLLQERGGLLITSPTASGKTEGVIGLIKDRPDASVCILTHRISLARHMINRLNQGLVAAGIDRCFESYEGLGGSRLRQIPLLVICINSLPKFLKKGEQLPSFDFVIMDEIEQQFSHLIGGTFSGEQAVVTHDVLRQLVKSARYVVGLDAYATELSYKWLCSVRGEDDVTWLKNTFRAKKGVLHLWSEFNEIIEQVERKLDESTLPVVVTTTSIKWAKILYAYFSGKMPLEMDELGSIRADKLSEESALDDTSAADDYGDSSLAEYLDGRFYNGDGLGPDVVAVIHGDNSQLKSTQDRINHINERLPKLRVLIYNSAMGTGVDIQAPVAGVFGFFSPETLPADELHQMLARSRKASEFHVCILPHPSGREVKEEALYNREIANADETSKLCNGRSTVSWCKDADDKWELHPQQHDFLRFWCKVTARNNKSLNRLQSEFARLAREEFEVVDHTSKTAKFDAIEMAISAHRKAYPLITKHLILNSPVKDQDTLDRLREQGSYDEADIAGNIRWHIEVGYGRGITDAIYDHWDDGGLRKLRTYADVVSKLEVALKSDQKQDAQGYAVPWRSHSLQRRELILAAIVQVWGQFEAFDKLTPVTSKQIEERMAQYLTTNQKQVWNVFRWRKAHDRKPKNVLTRLLKEMGLKPEKLRSGQHKGLYVICPQSLQVMREYTHHLTQDRRDLSTPYHLQKSA